MWPYVLVSFWQCLGLALCVIVQCGITDWSVMVLPFLCSFLHPLATYRELALGIVWLQNASVQLASVAEVPVNGMNEKPNMYIAE